MSNQVSKHLKKLGLETPYNFNESSKKNISDLFSQIMIELGLDLDNDSLSETPDRVAKMYVNELFSGLNYENFPKCTTINNDMKVTEPVFIGDIDISSTCEHHFITIDGLASVSYIPKDKVIGLSKINRIVDFFSRRPQVQERLTNQIKETLCYLLDVDDVAVYIKAKHFCVKARGIKDSKSYTITSSLGGKFKTDNNIRSEFFRSATND